ncbi:MAG: hypothetical protein GKR91_04465 [Pseudomonadales bacterium]|nr:hypothetical protein [Pseudomonadales bacterium]
MQSFSLEEEFSVYDSETLEPLLIMAQQLQEAGLHREVIESFDKAGQVSRVNPALYDEPQIGIIEAMISSDNELENWESVNQHYGYLEHLYGRIFDFDDPKLEDGLRKISAWHVNALNINLDGKRVQHLRKAHKIFKMRLAIAEVTLEENHPKFDFLKESIAISEQQLYLASDLYKEILRTRAVVSRDRLLAGLD